MEAIEQGGAAAQADDVTVVEYDLAELIGGSVESITAKLSALSDGELAKLQDAEKAAVKPRATLLSAIEAERTGRAVSNAAPATAVAGDANDAIIAKQAADIGDLESMLKPLLVGLRERELIDPESDLSAVADIVLGFIDEREGRIRTLEAARVDIENQLSGELALLNAQYDALMKQVTAAGGSPSVAKLAMPKKPKPIAAADGEIVFCGDAGAPITALPPMAFAAADFADRRGMLALMKVVDFPLFGNLAEVKSVFLTQGGKPVGCCDLMTPLLVGAGRSARIPAGSLVFRAD